MVEDIKPVWYWMTDPKLTRAFRFYLGRCEGRLDAPKHWTLNIGLWFVDFGRAY